jgi:anti-anti-sigma regulatory factor
MTSTGSPLPVTILCDESSGISVTGTLDATTVAALNRTVTDFFSLAPPGHLEVLVLDLSTVSACDKAALEAIRHAQAVCAREYVALRVVPSEAVRQVMCEQR